MNQNTRRVIVRAPITMVIGPVPDEVQGPSALFTFGLGHMQKILSDKGIKAQIEGKQVVATFAGGEAPAETMTAAGLVLDKRAYRVLSEDDQHKLEFSTDLGETFDFAGNFADADLANAVGSAWVDGRVEKVD